MFRTQVLKLVQELSPGTRPASGWDRDLPKYAEIDLERAALIVARSGSRYVLSAVRGSEVRSVVVSEDLTQSEIYHTVALFNALPAGGADRLRADAGPSAQDPSSLSGIGSGGPPQETRDPNAPPGFEDEHLLGRSQPRGPSIQFDPDRDLYPPGGPHPQLGPFDPFATGAGGMTPAPFGSSRPPNIREDPTSPFGARPGARPGSGPFEPGSSGPPFGGRPGPGPFGSGPAGSASGFPFGPGV